jgi:hypothetical protein
LGGVVRETGSALGDDVGSTRRSISSPRAALGVFGAVEVVALPLLFWWGRGGWFTFDDWDLLAQRTAGRAHDLFLPHGDHWSTLPILVYRALWWVFGIRTYVPYQVLVIVFHLVAAALLREVMRRAGTAPWTATIFAGVFVFFGVAADTILVGFFMTFLGSLVFGLVHLLLADHDGPVDRRDVLGLVAGLVGMLFSGVAVTMVVVVGLSTLVRRGWRIALLHTVPLGAVYLIWLRVIGTEGTRLPLTRPSLTDVARFVAVGVRAAFSGLGQIPGVGLALAATLVVGLVVGRAFGRSTRIRASEPLALLAGAVIFLVSTAFGRAGTLIFIPGGGPENARASRYVYLVVAMGLPALALATDFLIRRWRRLAPFLLLLPLLGLVGNVQKLADFHHDRPSSAGTRRTLLNAPHLALASSLPRSVEPDEFHAPGVTLGWLIDGVRSGRVPAPPATPKIDLATETLKLALRPSPEPRRKCVDVGRPTARVLQKGEGFSVSRGTVSVVYVPATGPASRPVKFNRTLVGSLNLEASVGPLRLVLNPSPATNQLCE